MQRIQNNSTSSALPHQFKQRFNSLESHRSRIFYVIQNLKRINLLSKISLATTADLSEPTTSSSYNEQIQFSVKNLNQFYQGYHELIQLSIKFNVQCKNNT